MPSDRMNSLMFEFQAPQHLGHYNPLSSPPIQPGDLQQPTPWIVSADFTDWLSRMPEEIFGQIPNNQMMEHNLPVDEVVKLENHNNEMYCRPCDVIPPSSEQESMGIMATSFPPESLQDFKHVLYNLLAEHHNHPSASTFLQPCTMEEDGVIRHGFRFNSRQNPEKKLPELYAQHIRKARLDCEDQSSVFIQDLYKYYLRACVELLSKYFEKRDKYTYLYDDIPLFVPGETLEQAEERIKTMKTRARKKRRIMTK
jgi:hypothetical protein